LERATGNQFKRDRQGRLLAATAFVTLEERLKATPSSDGEDTRRLDWLEGRSMKHETSIAYDLMPDCVTPGTCTLWDGKKRHCSTDLRATLDAARQQTQSR